MTPPFDSDRTAAAFELASRLHAGQVRKGTQVPYLSHLMAVAALVAEDRGGTDAVCAALLHDSAEDQGGEAALAEIDRRVGPRVAGLVRQCSDAVPEPGSEKQPWRVRKEAMLGRLPDLDRDALLVIAADKLHNLRAALTDEQLTGPEVWSRFKTGRDGFRWYHHEMARVLTQLVSDSRSVQLLAREVQQLDG